MEINLGETETGLQNNILKFGYGINYEYVGAASHSFLIDSTWLQNLNYPKYKI